MTQQRLSEVEAADLREMLAGRQLSKNYPERSARLLRVFWPQLVEYHLGTAPSFDALLDDLADLLQLADNFGFDPESRDAADRVQK